MSVHGDDAFVNIYNLNNIVFSRHIYRYLLNESNMNAINMFLPDISKIFDTNRFNCFRHTHLVYNLNIALFNRTRVINICNIL